jgi:zinc protease
MGTVLPLAPTDNDYAAVVIANHIFGGSLNSRLFSRVRERDGLSYSVGSRLRPRPGSRATQWIVEASYDLENADRTRAALRDELARALRDGFSADEVDVAITGYLARSLVRRADDAALAELLTLWTPSALAEFESRVSALTPGAVTAAFRRYVRPDLLTVARIR